VSRAATAVTTAAQVLVACAAPEAGAVYARYHYPESQWVELTCAVYRANGTCAVQMPVVRTNPERWSLGIRDGDDEGVRSVDRDEYRRCAVGDRYPDCGMHR
jgi:hypothetical protein